MYCRVFLRGTFLGLLVCCMSHLPFPRGYFDQPNVKNARLGRFYNGFGIQSRILLEQDSIVPVKGILADAVLTLVSFPCCFLVLFV